MNSDDFFERQARISECVSLLQNAYDSIKEFPEMDFKDLADDIALLIVPAKEVERKYYGW